MKLLRSLGSLALLATLLPVVPVAAQGSSPDLKALADELVRRLREHQQPDGLYGSGLADTARVLDLFARSPRRYNDLDGPFFRLPAQRLAESAGPAQPAGLSDAQLVLGLSACLTPPLAEARNAALQRLSQSDPGRDVSAWLVARTYATEFATNAAVVSAGTDGGENAALAVLRAAQPESVSPPPTTEPAAWAAWARAARLRGLKPSAGPEVQVPGEGAGFEELCAALELVIQLQGVPKTPAASGASAEPSTPAIVPAGRDLNTGFAAALQYLNTQQEQGLFGLATPGWSGSEPGITAMCTTAALKLAEALGEPRPPWADAALDHLVSLQKPDGAIYEFGLDVYTTSVAIEALLAGGREADRAVVARARDFLLAAQSDEGEGYQRNEDPHYGGVGYGGDERPDLSNTQMAIEAVVQAGTDPSHPFFDKVEVFLARHQNLSEAQALSWPRPGGGTLVTGNDGGSTYMPGNSPAGEDRVGEGLYQARSYGSMTFALAKSYMLCGRAPDDVRLAAAIRWLAANFTVDTNPGFAKPADAMQGLYYYYLTMARTLRRLPADGFRTAEGRPIAWRETLTRHLLDAQRVDGSWINEGSERWYEGSPTLCTAYAVLALIDASR
ncbi:MAG: hypothetical protein ACT4PU_11925 [Planctomycetota bacterium]